MTRHRGRSARTARAGDGSNRRRRSVAGTAALVPASVCTAQRDAGDASFSGQVAARAAASDAATRGDAALDRQFRHASWEENAALVTAELRAFLNA